MNREQARALVAQTFTQAFDKNRFATFVVNLLNHFDQSKGGSWNTQYIKDAFKEHVQRYERLGTYTSPENEKLDVLIVYLTAASKLERARTAIRNFVADHLKTRNEKEAALVAFVSPSEKQWRFSYVKMEYSTVGTELGKVGVETRLTPARRFSYLVGEGESCHTAQTRFLTLLQDTGTNPTLANIGDAFSVEAVTKEFFKKYAGLFSHIHAALENLLQEEKAVRDEFKKKKVNTIDFAKKLMGQVVFLYFLQKKGWLGVPIGQNWGDGPHDFLRQLAKGAHGAYKNFFNDVLEPLFYDTLATDRGHQAWCDRLHSRIPFLNGGLFEPLGDYDWGAIDILLPNELFTNAEVVDEGTIGTGILDVFDRYNFTVNEAEPLETEVAIDPEMLGKVFENLIEENRRKGLGAYYTPREIVHYMCQESLINYLDSSLNKEGVSIPRSEIDTFVHLGEQISHYESVKTKYSVKMPKTIEQNARRIDEILAQIAVCDPAVGSGAFPVGMMTEIVRARCTLTPYFNDVHERTPYYFKRHAIQNCLYGVDIDVGAVEIAKLRLWLSLVVDEEETAHIKPLPNLDFKIVSGNSLIAFPFKSHGLQDIEKLKSQFFEETDHNRKGLLKLKIENALRECFTSSKTSLGYEVNFDFRINFSEVFSIKGGFDIVVANPPYGLLNKRQNKHHAMIVSEGELQYFKSSPEYSSARGGMINVFRLFIVRSINILRKGGSFSEIFPLAFACDATAANLRREILEHHRIVGIEAFPERDNEKKRVFEAVKMSVCILFAQAQIKLESPFWLRLHRDKFVDPRNEKVSLGLETIKMIDRIKYTIPLLKRIELTLVESVYRNATSLASIGHCYTGEIDLTQDKAYLSRDKRHSVLIKGAIIDRYAIRASMSQGEIMFLDSRQYLANNHGERANHHRHPRIVMQGITGVNEKVRLKMTTIDAGTFCANSVNYIVLSEPGVQPEFILGLMNSTLLNFIFMKTSTNSNVNGYEVDNLPIKLADSSTREQLVRIVKQILIKKRANPDADTKALEEEIDTLVYRLYDLTSEDIKLVQIGIRYHKPAFQADVAALSGS